MPFGVNQQAKARLHEDLQQLKRAIDKTEKVGHYVRDTDGCNGVELALKLELPLAIVRSELLRLEREGKIEQFAGDWWQRVEGAEWI